MYAVYPVERLTPRRLTLSGGASFTGPIGEFLGGSRRVAVFLTTAGEEIVELAERATRSRDTLSGLVYDAIGSHVADAVVERVAADLRRRLDAHEALTLPYSPGYCGISLAQQRTIFRLLDARRIGVELLPALIMKPVKSVSGLIGIGPREQVQAAGNPCDRCAMIDCRMRRETR
jgi:cobalamin-dependent methionine synthase I